MRSVLITTVIISLSSNVPALASPVNINTSERERNCHVNPKGGDICAIAHRVCGAGATGFPCTSVSKVPVSTMTSTTSSSTTALVSSTTDSTSVPQTTTSRSIRRHKDEPRALRLPSTHPPAPIPAIPTFTFKAIPPSTSETSVSSSTAALSSFPDACRRPRFISTIRNACASHEPCS